MKTKVQVKGTRELDAALGELAKATARNVLQRAAMKALEPVEEDAKRLAPERSGVLKSKIRRTTRKPKGHRTKAVFAEAMRRGATRAEAGAAQRKFNAENGSTFAEAFVGVEEGVAQAWPQEVGTHRHGPQPYMRPSWEANKEQVLETVLAEIKPEIDRAAERARKRALKRGGKL